MAALLPGNGVDVLGLYVDTDDKQVGEEQEQIGLGYVVRVNGDGKQAKRCVTQSHRQQLSKN